MNFSHGCYMDFRTLERNCTQRLTSPSQLRLRPGIERQTLRRRRVLDLPETSGRYLIPLGGWRLLAPRLGSRMVYQETTRSSVCVTNTVSENSNRGCLNEICEDKLR